MIHLCEFWFQIKHLILKKRLLKFSQFQLNRADIKTETQVQTKLKNAVPVDRIQNGTA